MLPDWAWNTLDERFQRLGSDSFIVVSPGGMLMYTSSAEAIHQITQRREAFPKDTAKYVILKLFGDNVITTEGPAWKLHRKVTSASFNEKNAAHTFAEAIRQTHGMLDMYFAQDDQRVSTKTLDSIEHDTMTWALNIIGYVGFGLRLIWPGQKLPEDTDPRLAKYGSLEPPPGYTMTFGASLAKMLEKILVLLLVPWSLLSTQLFFFLAHWQTGPPFFLFG
jgi:cytochrome P450